jgi:hypothetical protein
MKPSQRSRVLPLLTPEAPGRIQKNFELRDGVATRTRFNVVVETGVPGFIPRGR